MGHLSIRTKLHKKVMIFNFNLNFPFLWHTLVAPPSWVYVDAVEFYFRFCFFIGSDSEEELEAAFEGFFAEDIAFLSGNIITNVPMEDFTPENDSDFPGDVEAGWTSHDDFEVNRAPFTGEAKLKVKMQNSDAIDFLKLFVDDGFLDELVTQTNVYAQSQLNEAKLKEHSRIKKWQAVTVDEMKVFISLVLAMGLVQKHELQQYWSTEETHLTPFFRKYMSRDRFLGILSNLHLVDNDLQVPRGQVGFDPLFKIRPFLTLMNRFSEVYSPERELSFDEATCVLKDNLHFSVFKPAKPSKSGIKIYQVCEAMSGYLVGFELDTNSSPITDYADALLGENDCTMETKVLGLMSRCGLLDKGHHVYMDDCYTSPELFTELELLNTYACGGLKKNRYGLPEAFAKPVLKLKQTETMFRRNEVLLAVKYRDKRDILMLSTIHQATVSVLTKTHSNTNINVTKPTCIVDYIAFMEGVNLSDRINQYGSCLRKTTKWYKKLFFHLLNMCVMNAYVLFKKFAPGDTGRNEHHAFRMSICKSLLREAMQAPRPMAENDKKSYGEQLTRLTGHHFPGYIPAKPGAKRAHPRRDCVACNVKQSMRKNRQRRQSSFWCPDCEVTLCIPDCFRVFHTVQDYKAILVPDTVDPVFDTVQDYKAILDDVSSSSDSD